MDRAYGTKREEARYNPGLKSGAIKSVIRKADLLQIITIVHSN